MTVAYRLALGVAFMALPVPGPSPAQSTASVETFSYRSMISSRPGWARPVSAR